MATGSRNDPLRAYNFLVEIDGVARAGFREVSGLDSSINVVEYREGNEPSLAARKLPGQVKFSNVTLKWGTIADSVMWDWYKAGANGKVERRNFSIVLLDDTREEKARWNFREAWPIKWTGPSLNATGNEVAIETLEIAHEGVEKA